MGHLGPHEQGHGAHIHPGADILHTGLPPPTVSRLALGQPFSVTLPLIFEGTVEEQTKDVADTRRDHERLVD